MDAGKKLTDGWIFCCRACETPLLAVGDDGLMVGADCLIYQGTLFCPRCARESAHVEIRPWNETAFISNVLGNN